MQRAKSRKSAHKPDEHQSLFKFMMYFNEHTEEYRRKAGRPWVWYSFDMPDERDMFAPGLAPDLRTLYTDLLRRAQPWPDLYQFLRECYPVWTPAAGDDHNLDIYMPKHVVGNLADISTRYAETVEFLMRQVGVTNYRVGSGKSRTVPGFSPSKLPNQEFFGIRAFEQNPQVSFWFTTRALKMVKIYDHRCYHAENLYGTIGQDEYPAPAGVLSPPPRTLRPGQHSNGRFNQPASVGSILGHIVQH
ncbi:hypothetical protein [uncultured Spirosoma sp.]|uniref:hypothetical protein n=1 Tax=uncultured Spirosoma sp. TaxID=278208 RepID=UPI0025890CCF|nr:hypothetical protein [uncultured Spirosoma sp.]